MRRPTRPVFASILILTLTACGSSEGNLAATASPTAVIEFAASEVTSTAATSTPILPAPTHLEQSEGSQAQMSPTKGSPFPPLRFVMPTPGAEPISGWRPPLYPLPWAISPHDHFYFARPIAADQINWPLADYRYGGVFFDHVTHTGVDIDAQQGSPVLAAGPGTVVWAGWGLYSGYHGNMNDPYGMAVVIRHNFGYRGQQLYTIYAHMSRVDTVVGEHVQTGDHLGLVGDTGNTTGPHLHFEVRLGANSFNNTLNPELWMAPPQGWGVLAGRLTDSHGQALHRYPVDVRSEETGRLFTVKTYGGEPANSDPYYNEDLVLSDLPAGLYKITLNYQGRDQQDWVTIYPGQVSYFTFKGGQGFSIAPPPAQAADYLPITPTP